MLTVLESEVNCRELGSLYTLWRGVGEVLTGSDRLECWLSSLTTGRKLRDSGSSDPVNGEGFYSYSGHEV